MLISDTKYDASEKDETIIDPTISSSQAILGMSSSPNRARPRYSYPVSATEWTEYTSPLLNPRVNFYIDSTGDRSQPTGISRHKPLACRIKHTAIDVCDARITSEISSVDQTTNTVLTTGQATSGSGDVPSNDITLSPEQKHVLDLVQAGKK
jgi:hypothetical protein